MSGPAIQTERLSKWYGQVIGLNDVTVSIPPGITGLLGPNGAGKSTFMKLLAAQLRPSQGRVLVLGEPVWGNPALFRRVGFCPEPDAFYDRMTGLDWVAGLLRLHGYDEAASVAAARDALAAVGLTEVEGLTIGAYSRGMRQRVKLAQAVAHAPDLLILDEPLTGMDPLARRATVALIRERAREGCSVLVSSHILHEIEALTSNILLVHEGRILAEGHVRDIRALIDEHPHTVSVRTTDPRALAAALLAHGDVLSLRFEPQELIVQTARPDEFYDRLTHLAAAGEAGSIEEVVSPDDNLQAVFAYLVGR